MAFFGASTFHPSDLAAQITERAKFSTKAVVIGGGLLGLEAAKARSKASLNALKSSLEALYASPQKMHMVDVRGSNKINFEQIHLQPS